MLLIMRKGVYLQNEGGNKLEDFLGCGFSGFTPREVLTTCAVFLEAILTSVDVCLFLEILYPDMYRADVFRHFNYDPTVFLSFEIFFVLVFKIIF